MQKSGKIKCPCCGKEWNWVKIYREKISSGKLAEAFDIMDNTLYIEGNEEKCCECGTVLNINLE
jgi:hypothetical protein